MARTFASASSQYLENGAALIADEPITLACFFKVAALATSHTLMGFSQSGGTARQIMQVTSVDNINAFSSATGGGASGFNATTNGTVTGTGIWHHGIAVFASSTSRVNYINGVLDTFAPDSTNVDITGINRTTIGARYNTSIGSFFNGTIAEAAIWNAALDASEAAALAKGFSPQLIRPASLVEYWPLIGRTSPEIGIKGNTMTLVNSPTTGDHARVIRPVGKLAA